MRRNEQAVSKPALERQPARQPLKPRREAPAKRVVQPRRDAPAKKVVQPRRYPDPIDDTLDDSFPASDPPSWAGR